jgi:hypothetical protein
MIDLDTLIRDADPTRDLIIPEPDPLDADRLTREGQRSPRRTEALLASIGVAVALAVVAIALTSGPHRQPSTTQSTSVPSATGPLFSILGVLRRSQSAADRAAAMELADQPAAQRARIERVLAARERRLAARGIHDAALEQELRRLRAEKLPARAPDPQVRLAAVTPWGEQVILVPYRSGRTEELCVDFGTGGANCGLTAGLIQAGGAWSLEGAGRAFAGGSTGARLFIVVPDGVAKVAFVVPRQSPVPGGPIYGDSFSVLVPVHNNVAFAQVSRRCCSSMVTRWYAADGRLIRVTGNPAAANRVTGPQPSPETLLSRAAERNPSTPNPVHVTPSAGGPSTAFRIQWRVLISDADYKLSAIGPTGTDCLGASDLNGATFGGGINDVRGQLYGATIPGGPLSAARVHALNERFGRSAPLLVPGNRRATLGSNGWCPGTYHVSVAFYDLGLSEGPNGPYRPFGNVTFIVKR